MLDALTAMVWAMVRGDDGEKGDGVTFKTNITAYRSDMAALVRRTEESVMELVPEAANAKSGALTNMLSSKSGAKAERALNEICETFKKLDARAAALGGDLSEADLDTHRTALRAQKTAMALKMETSRAAAAQSLKNQSAELEAHFHKELEHKVAALMGGEASALAEAHREIEEVKEELATAKKDADKAITMQNTVKGLLRTKEAEEKKRADELAEMAQLANGLQQEVDELRAALAAAQQEADEARGGAAHSAQLPVHSSRARSPRPRTTCSHTAAPCACGTGGGAHRHARAAEGDGAHARAAGQARRGEGGGGEGQGGRGGRRHGRRQGRPDGAGAAAAAATAARAGGHTHAIHMPYTCHTHAIHVPYT